MKRVWISAVAVVTVFGAVLLFKLGSRESPPSEILLEGQCTLQHRHIQRNEKVALSYARGILALLPDRPQYVRDLPPGIEQAGFYELQPGSGPPIALCLSRGHKLWVDTDGDGVLSDEVCFEGKVLTSGQPPRGYGPVTLKSGASFTVVSSSGDPSAWLITQRDGYRIGRMLVDGNVYTVVAVDGDYDGRFGSVFSPPIESEYGFPESDLLAITLEKNKKSELSRTQYCNPSPLGRMIQIEGKYYAVELADDGSHLALQPTQPLMGELALDCPDCEFECTLWSDAAMQSLYFTHASKARTLPAGTYAVTEAKLWLKHAKGDPAWVGCSHPSGDLGFIEIRHGATTTVKLGAPFVVGVQTRRSGDQVILQPVLKGRAGETYTITATGNATARQPPGFRITDEQGKELQSGQFVPG